MLSKPSKATPVPAFSVSCEKENRSRNVQEPIPDSNRHGDRNPRVFLLAKVIYKVANSILTNVNILVLLTYNIIT